MLTYQSSYSSSLYVHNKLHGTIQNSQLCPTINQSENDDSPNYIRDLSLKIMASPCQQILILLTLHDFALFFYINARSVVNKFTQIQSPKSYDNGLQIKSMTIRFFILILQSSKKTDHLVEEEF